MMEEYRAQSSRAVRGVSLPTSYLVDWGRDQITLGYIKSQPNPEQFVRDLYNQYYATIAAGKVVPRNDDISLTYAKNPIGLDLGVGNIRFGFAIYLLNKYYAQNENSDPLDLRKYQGDYVRLFADMIDANSNTSISVAGLVVADARDFYLYHEDVDVRNAFLSASQADKDRLIDFRYRSSKELTTAVVKDAVRMAKYKRDGFPDFFKGDSIFHPNIYQHIGGILDGSKSVFGSSVVSGGNAVFRPPQWNFPSSIEFFIDGSGYRINNGSGRLAVSTASSGTSSETVFLSLFDNDNRVVRSTAVYGVVGRYDGNGDFVEPVHITNTASSVVMTVEINPNTKITVTASKVDGSMTMTANGQAMNLQPDSQIRVTPGVNGGPATMIVSDVKAVTGQQYVIDAAGNISTPSTVNVALGQLRVDGVISMGSREFNPNAAVVKVGDIIGSTIGNYLSGGNKLLGVVYSSALGEIGQRIGGALNGAPQGLKNDAGKLVNSSVAASFTADVWSRMQGAAIGTASSMLSAELAKVIGLNGIGGEIFSTATSSVIGKVIENALDGTAKNLFSGVFDANAVNSLAGAGGLMANALGSFFGSKLGSMVVKPRTQAAVALSSIGSAVGVWAATGGIGAFTSFLTGTAATTTTAATAGIFGAQTWVGLNFLAPGVGAFVGFVLGALIGNLFGKKKPKIPSAGAETVLQIPYANYQLGTVTVTNNGDRGLVTAMATTARDTLNGLIGMVAYTETTAYVSNLNGYGTTQVYGHTGNQIWVKINGVQNNFTSADQAVEYGTLTAIRNTKIVGGDLLLKRAILNSNATDLAALSGDFTIVEDYAYYRANYELINGYIVNAFPTSTDPALAAQIAGDKAFYVGAAKDLVDKILAVDLAGLSAAELATYNSNKPQYDRVIAMVGAQSIANPWIITLQRVSELGLDKFATSDFYGGLRGFLDSFDLKGHGAAYENIRISAQGAGAQIQSTKQTSDGLFSILPQSAAGPGDNDILNARFESGMQGWDMATWQVANPQRGVNLNADWSGSGNDVFWMHMPGTPAAGSVIDVRSALMVSSAGVTYESSVKAANHRGLAQMYVEFYDANMNQVGGAFMNGQGLEGGSWHGDLANYNTISGTATAPPGTAYRRMVLRLVATGGEVPFGFFTQPTSRAVDHRIASWEDQGEVLRIDDMSLVGYTVTNPGATTSGNDFIDQRLAIGGVTIDDTHSVWVEQYDYYWNGWDYEQVDNSYWSTGDGGDDIFVGGAGGDHLYGRNGWDWLDGRGGNDYLDGGDGNDTLLGGAGEDVLLGGAGDDYLAGGDGTDSLDGGAGNDVLADSWGSEVLQGGDGDDTFLIAEDGTFNWFWGGYADPNSDPNGKDTISAERLGFGVAFDIDYRPPDWNGNPDATAGNPISRAAVVTNAVTGAWVTSEGLLSIENATGSAFADRIYGTTGDNVLKGLEGEDQLWGRDGNDTIEGGAGADVMDGGGGYDWLSYLTSSAGVYIDLSTGGAYGGDAEGDVFSGFEAVRGSKASDRLKGYNGGDNWLDGDAGDDWMIATTGNDVFVGGEGKDFVDYSEGFAAGASTYQVWVEDGYWEYDQWDNSQYWVVTGGHYENVTTTTMAALTVNLGAGTAQARGVDGTVSNHSFIGVEGVIGTAYADTMYGGAADETFIGGGGNDILQGGGGADTYIIARGDGSDTVYEDNTGWNVISFGKDVKFSDIWGGTAGGASGWLDLGIRGDAQVRVVSNFGAYPTAGNNKIKSIDLGGVAKLDIGAITFGVASNDASTTLVGSRDTADLILAMNGDDIVWGAASNHVESNGNVVVGGLGNDEIHTSNGDDQFGYDRGEGRDLIWDTGGEDTLVFGPSVAAEDLIYEVYGEDLYIGARNLANPTQTARFVSDVVVIVGGGLKSVEVDAYNQRTGVSFQNTVEYITVGGTSIDVRKLDIKWTEVPYYNYNYVYPIALDLNGDGLDLLTVEASSVVAKTVGGGISKVGWVGPTDGFLAVDRDGDGAINKLSELSFVQDKPGATSDLEGLRTWDSNGDGLLDKNDKDFSRILLFVDANQNGRSTASELRTLEEAGIVAINLGGAATGLTASMVTESFVQNTISFVWADGRSGQGYDVALARRVLGSVGLNAGAYQAEWGAKDADGELGQLANDPKAVALAARIKAKKGLLDAIGASYDEVKAAAKLDFSDHDRIDATIAQRWQAMNTSEQASWLAQGQQPSEKIKRISAQQSLVNDLNAAAKARQDVVDQSYAQAGQAVTAAGFGQATGEGGAPAGVSELGVSFGAPGLGLSLAGGELLDDSPTYGGSGAASSPWWRLEAGSDLMGGGSLGARLAAMEAGPGQRLSMDLAASSALDPALVQNQALLRQAMAGFGGGSGGSAAVWTRDGASRETPLAASAGLKAQPLLTT